MKNIMKFGMKQGTGSIKIGLASLNASLSSAKNYNQTFEDPAYQMQPQKITPIPTKEFKPMQNFEKKSDFFPKQTEDFPENKKKFLIQKELPEKIQEKKAIHQFEEDVARHKNFTREFAPKNRSLSPPPQHVSNKREEKFVKNEIPNRFRDFGKKSEKELQPDISIDMKTTENTSIFDVGLSELTTSLLTKRKIYTLFPLQAQSFEPIKSGMDLVGKAKTGTGKTMAFVLPLLEKLREKKIKRVPKILVVSPTRELANQITDEFRYYGPDFRCVCCYGGVPLNKQIDLISRGLEIIVATPGRLLDLMGRNLIPLEEISTVVIDEADHMMDIGFKDDLDEILRTVNKNVRDLQLLLFSATMPPWIRNIASSYLKPKKLFIDAVGNENQTADKIKHYAIPCTDEDLEKTLDLIISFYAHRGKALIFTDTKSHVAHLTARMVKNGEKVGCLHGDMNQYSRDQTINSFKNGEINCLIATDVAARGLDIPYVELVFQVRPPQNIANYIHRSGRTGRVGREGISVIMFNPGEDQETLYEIEKKASIEFERRGIPTAEEFAEVRALLQEEVKESRQKDKEDLIYGRFRMKNNDIRGGKVKLEDALAKLNKPREYFSRSLLSGNSRKTTLMVQSNKKKYELKSMVEKMLDGIFIHCFAFSNEINAILFDVSEENIQEVMNRFEKSDMKCTKPIFLPPKFSFLKNPNNENHSLNHGKEGKKKGYGGGYEQKFHKTISQSSKMNKLENKKPYPSFNFYARKKE